MSMSLLLALLLPTMQEDPQVTYREGLFEEVDQGNLEKAAELYGKVLKSGAPDELKAKALLRTGFCHEKKGKSKEAEQAWRDVVERYPGAAETVKLARERLETQSRAPGAGPGQLLDASIQALILDLGGTDFNVRAEAIRKLGLIAEPAIPQLRKALHHKDGSLAVGAARVLSQLELKEGLYEPLITAFSRYNPSSEDAAVLGTLLYEREDLRGRFVKDREKVANTDLIGIMHWVFSATVHPEFPKILEDWLVNPKLGVGDPTGPWSMSCRFWSGESSESDQVRAVERLTSSDTPQYSKLFMWLSRCLDSRKPPGKLFHTAVLAALSRHPRPEEIVGQFSGSWWFSRVLNPADLISGPVSTWFAKGNVQLKKTIVASGVSTSRSGDKDLWNAFRKFLFARMGDRNESWEIRMAIDNEGFTPETPEETTHAVAFALDLIKETEGKPEPPGMRVAMYNLLERIPSDSKDLPLALDTAFDKFAGEKEGINPRLSKDSRAEVVAASLRAVRRKARGMNLALAKIKELGTPEEKVELGPLLPAIPPERSWWIAAEAYGQGIRGLPPVAWDDAWKGFRKIYEAGRPELRRVMLFQIMDWTYPRVEELMKEGASSPHEEVRSASIWYWGHLENGKGIPSLVGALEDKSESNKKLAITSLGGLHALDSVPSLIRFLENPDPKLRDLADEALKQIRKHYEERAEWQRWYDETKKTLNK